MTAFDEALIDSAAMRRWSFIGALNNTYIVCSVIVLLAAAAVTCEEYTLPTAPPCCPASQYQCIESNIDPQTQQLLIIRQTVMKN